MNRAVFILRQPLLDAVRSHFDAQNGREGAGYFFCGSSNVNCDPWTGGRHEKFSARDFEPVPSEAVVSSSRYHISWETSSFIRVLRRCREEDEIPALIHFHPGGLESFSPQDDRNEAELFSLVKKRNGQCAKLISLILLPDGRLFGRVWNEKGAQPFDLVFVLGHRYSLHYAGRGSGQPTAFLNRQALALGNALNEDLGQLRAGIVGGGATGSAVALMLPRLGIRNIAIFDNDGAHETNLNRLHFSSASDARCNRPKVELIKQGIDAMELGTSVRVFQAWISDPTARDALKSCDVLFGCTDDHVGRLLLNRFAYFYSTPVIDMGLGILVGDGNLPQVHAFDGRVTVLQPGTTCLLCRQVIDVRKAYAESLKRNDPSEYERQKSEAYVLGEGNPSPAVVPFTTSVATMAVEELIHRLQGFRGPDGSADQRLRQFHRGADRKPGHNPAEDCPLCCSPDLWGRGDIDPFLDANI